MHPTDQLWLLRIEERLTIKGKPFKSSANPEIASTKPVIISAKTRPTISKSSACLSEIDLSTLTLARDRLAERTEPGTAAFAAEMALDMA